MNSAHRHVPVDQVPRQSWRHGMDAAEALVVHHVCEQRCRFGRRIVESTQIWRLVGGPGTGSGVRLTAECSPGTRAADIAGSSITSASNAEVEAVAQSLGAAEPAARRSADAGRRRRRPNVLDSNAPRRSTHKR